MARPSDKEIIASLIATYEPQIRQSFLDALQKIRSSIILKVIVERLERHDLEGAIAAMNLEVDAFALFERSIVETYTGGGVAFVENLPRVRGPDGQPVIFRWSVRNSPAEQEIRRHATDLVDDMLPDTRAGIREVLAEGLARGENPWVMARDVVGRRNRATNTRVGGYLGLTQPQMQTVEWVKRALLENDVEGLKRYLGMTDDMIGMPRRELLRELKGRGLKLRDRRFDGSIIDVIEGKSKIGQEGAVKVYTQYAERSLDYRGKVMAREETMTALSKSRDDAYQQQIDAGKLDAQDVTLTWLKTPREHPRLQHLAMNGKTVPFGQPFIMPDDTRIRYPHDPKAPAKHKIGCQCRVRYDVDFTAAALRSYRARTGG